MNLVLKPSKKILKNNFKSTSWTIQSLVFFLFILLVIVVQIQPAFAQQKQAEEDIKTFLSSSYASPKWNEFVKEGFKALHSEDYESAQKAFYKAFNLGCESPLVTFALALISEYKGSHYSAVDYYKMAAEKFKASHSSHRWAITFNENYGRALWQSGKREEALPLLRRAAQKTKSYWLLKMLGMMAYEQGDTLNALSYLERAVRIKDASVTRGELALVYGLLGKLFYHKGETNGAMRYYQQVLELDPQNPEANQFMREIQKRQQQEDMYKSLDKLIEQD